MIERKFVAEKLKEYQIQEFIADNLKKVGHSYTKMKKTPLGEKVIIHASRPGLIVGKKGQNIKKLTKTLKKKFDLENPQIEISEVSDINTDAQIVAERISNSLERYGIARFKGVGHKVMTDAINAGALGIEIIMSGKIPSSRAKRWRFYQGYLKKCGDLAQNGVDKAYSIAKLKTGIVGIQVRIMPKDIELPDKVEIRTEAEIEEGAIEIKEEKQEPAKKEKKKTRKKKEETKEKEVVKEEQ
ncbi:MAG: 30S ribosomal protein S3 [Nanoarchaeota archaeon]|nr:30S ribosomal protein S3 [Nanoarchaeota archaeon]